MIGRHRKSLSVNERRSNYDRFGGIRFATTLPTQLVHAIGEFIIHIRNGLCDGFLVQLQKTLLIYRRNFNGIGRKSLVPAETRSDRCNKRKLEWEETQERIHRKTSHSSSRIMGLRNKQNREKPLMLHKNSKIPGVRVLLGQMSPLNDEIVREEVEELTGETESTLRRRMEESRLHATEALDKHNATTQHIQNAEQNHRKRDGNTCT